MEAYEIRVTWFPNSLGARVRVVKRTGEKWETVLDRECFSAPSTQIAVGKAELELGALLMAAGVLDPS